MTDDLEEKFNQIRKAAKKVGPHRRPWWRKNPLDWGWHVEVSTKEIKNGYLLSTWGPVDYIVTYRHKKWPVSATSDHPQITVAYHSARRVRKVALQGYKTAVKHGLDTTCWDQATNKTTREATREALFHV